jgi:hypothetical protein
MSADIIQNVGKAAWAVIKDGEPSEEVGRSTANAVPQVDDWQSLETGFYPPKSISMKWSKPVAYPWDDYVFVEFTILLKWDYGARYRGGGAYINGIWIEVPQAYDGWSWHTNIDVWFHAPSNANVGKKDAPIARIPVTVAGTVKTYEQSHHVEWGFTLYGNGSWTSDS